MSTINVDTVSPANYETVNVNNVQVSSVNSSGSMRLGNIQATVQGFYNTVVGQSAVISSTASNNTAVGYLSGALLSTGQRNTFLGANSARNMTDGNNNVILGDQAGYNALTTQSSVIIGKDAGFNCTDSVNSVFIGSGAGQGVGNLTGAHNVAIGAGSTLSSGSASNEFVLGSLSTYTLRCNVTTITSLSDERDKKEIEELPVGLDFVKKLKPVKFVWNDREEEGRHEVSDFGFIAQDLKAAQEEVEMADMLKLVYESNPERLEASYGKLIPILVKAIQDLNAKVELLENK